MTPRGGGTTRHGTAATAFRRRFLRALVRNISRHATLFPWLCHQPSLAAPPEWSAVCVTSLHSLLGATVERCTFSHVLPHLQVLCVVCSPLSSLSRFAGPPSCLSSTRTLSCCSRRSSELTRLNTRPRAAGGLLVLHHRSHLLRTLRVGSLNSCHRFSFGKLHHQRESLRPVWLSPRSENGIKLHEQQQRQTIRKLFCFCLWNILPLRGPLGLKAEQINSNFSPYCSITLSTNYRFPAPRCGT